MKFGAQLKVYRAQWDEMEAYIQAMEAGRWNSIWFGCGSFRTTSTFIAVHELAKVGHF